MELKKKAEGRRQSSGGRSQRQEPGMFSGKVRAAKEAGSERLIR